MSAKPLLDPYSYSIDKVMNYMAMSVFSMLIVGYYVLRLIPTHDLFVYLMILFWIFWTVPCLMLRLYRYYYKKTEDILFYQIRFFGMYSSDMINILRGAWVILVGFQIYLLFFADSGFSTSERLNFFLIISFILVNSFNEFCIHRNGIYFAGKRYFWEELENYTWQGNEQDHLVLDMRRSNATFSDLLHGSDYDPQWRVSLEQKEQVEAILSSRMPI